MIAAVEAYTPSLQSLRERRPHGGAIAVSREVPADLETPVSAYLKIRAQGPSFLLESVEGGERIGRYSFLGAAVRRVLRVKDGKCWFDGEAPSPCLDPLMAAQEMVNAYGPAQNRRARFEGGVLGYLSYEAARSFERLPSAPSDPLGLPDATFLDVDTVLIFDHVAHTIRIVSHAWLDRPIESAYREAVDRIDELACALASSVARPVEIELDCGRFTSNMSQSRFEEMVRQGKQHIEAGDILQVVLSHRLKAPFRGDAFALYRRLRTVNPSPYMYYFNFGDHQIVGASPELLVQVEGGLVTCRPIAGTRRRGGSLSEDEVLAKALQADPKERAEHLMLVDLARNDVGRVSHPGSVSVGNFMSVERFSHVMHLVSDVTGRLDRGLTPYDALRAAFPAGTVSGAPKIRAMEIIADLEEECRGPYAGAVGFINTSSDLEVAITIRTGVVKDGMLYVQTGAGIVADSVPEEEYIETMNKARALIEAAGGKL